MNRHRLRVAVGAAVLYGLTGATLGAQAPATASAPKQYVFPGKGQTAQQQQSDEAACGKWASGETGFDPARPPVYQPPPPPPPPQKGGAMRGAARGAATGYVIGDLANDEGGEGAAIGAVVGATSASSKQKQRQQAAARQAEADKKAFDDNVKAMQHEFYKARSACLEAKGYTVK